MTKKYLVGVKQLKRKHILILTACLVLLLTAPTRTFAFEPPTITTSLDFTLSDTDHDYPGDSGEGWAWDAAQKRLTLSGLDIDVDEYFVIKVPDGTEIALVTGTSNYIANQEHLGILCQGDLKITGSGNLIIDTEGTGIRAPGDLVVENVETLQVVSNYVGIRVGPGRDTPSDRFGNLEIRNCDVISIDSRRASLRATGNLTIDGVDLMSFSTSGSSNAVRIGPGSDKENETFSGAQGNAVITNSGTITVDAGHTGFRITGDLTIDGAILLDITSRRHTGIRVGPGCETPGDAVGHTLIQNIETMNIDAGHHGMRIMGGLTLRRINAVNFAAQRSGLRVGYGSGSQEWTGTDFPSHIRIEDCNSVFIHAEASEAVRGLGTWDAARGIYANNGNVEIVTSTIDVYGTEYGIVTGPLCGSGEGGDIVIRQSSVDASCDSDVGIAALFSGDDLEYGEEGQHARILLTDSRLVLPQNARIADVNIADVGCQSITAEDIQIITSYEQMAKTVTIEAIDSIQIYSIFASSRPVNGGTVAGGGSFEVGTTATLIATAKPGHEFAGWWEGSVLVSTESTYRFPVYGNRTLVADFPTLVPAGGPADLTTSSGRVQLLLKSDSTQQPYHVRLNPLSFSQAPKGYRSLGLIHEVLFSTVDGQTQGVVFDVPADLIFRYFDFELLGLPKDAPLRVYYYHPGSGVWVPLVSRKDEMNQTVSASIGHTTQFALLAEAQPMERPTIDPVPDWVSGHTLTVSGNVPDGSPATLYVNDRPLSIVVDDTGNFQMDIILDYGPNHLFVVAGEGDQQLASYEVRVVANPVMFSDIDGHWAHDYIVELAARNITTGYPGTTQDEPRLFKPDITITRGEFITLLMRAMGMDESDELVIFSDTEDIPDWMMGSVQAAVEAGIIAGYDDNTFQPHEDVTRAEMAVMMGRVITFMQLETEVDEATLFTDEELIPVWAQEGVRLTSGLGIITGYTDGRFLPTALALRGEAAAMLVRLLNLL